jgi:L-alanine-DL-glutamate epimerase-like enolase superfamily enzyme
LSLPRKRFEISSGVRETAEVFVVEVRYKSFIGLGSGTPATSIGDNVSACAKGLARAKDMQIDPETYFDEEIELDVRDISPAAAAALDIAMWDLQSKLNGVSLAAYIGGSPREVPTDATIDLRRPGEARRDAAALSNEGFRSIKVKVGKSLIEDLERVKAVREAVGPKVNIFVDANGGYDFEKAVEFWEKAAPLDLDFFEQPVPQDRMEDLAALRKKGVRICADESIVNEESLERAIDLDAVDIINIKLMKCGGIGTAIEMSGMAGDAGLEIMIGCMGDIGVSIAAAAHFACSIDAEYADLDSHLNIAHVCDGPEVSKGSIQLKEEPGHGVHLAGDWLNYRMTD